MHLPDGHAIPEAPMLAAADRIASFIRSGGTAPIADAFEARDVTILENFPPFLFRGPSAVLEWSNGMRAHLVGLSDLEHKFGRACDFSQTGDIAYFSLHTTWSGRNRGRPFREEGGWAFVLRHRQGEWRVQNYAWAVTTTGSEPAAVPV
jgi:hypothetical protein